MFQTLPLVFPFMITSNALRSPFMAIFFCPLHSSEKDRCRKMPVTPFKPFIISAQVGLAQKMENLPQSDSSCIDFEHSKLLMKNIQRGWCTEPGMYCSS